LAQVTERDASLLSHIQALKAEPPFWGYRRRWAYLRFVEQLPIHKKRVLRVMREQHLLVKSNPQLKAKRTLSRSKPRPTTPLEWWGSDRTKVSVDGFGWVYIVLVLEWSTQKIVGDDAGRPYTARHWLTALEWP
jgi:putative transposase